ncbi:hypothetical protein B0E48_12235 [Rhodanobacter sp. C03]|nr:hypothetical protein B0E48_12235 [Rhodanobacter sp. C03]
MVMAIFGKSSMVIVAALCILSACSQGASTFFDASATTPIAAAFCAKLQASVQPMVTAPLTSFSIDDSTTDEMHAGERDYVRCIFRQRDSQIDVSLHDDTDGLFDDSGKKGYAALSGFGDKARYTVGREEMQWVDVVHGSIACETRFAVDARLLNGDWKQVAGKMCEAAFAAR